MPLFDTHAHLDNEQLLPILPSLLTAATEQGLVGITAIGTTLKTSEACLELARQHRMVHAAVGIHPNDCHQATGEQWEAISQMASSKHVVAIGETGLDRYWDYCPIETQRTWFSQHIDLSFETNKPLVIHMRDCEADILEMLEAHQRDGKIIGIMHSFTGQWETAQRCLELGMYISFAGMVTFKKSVELRGIAKRIPDDRILVETDSPYLSPHPHRSVRPNQPAMVRHTADCLAEARGVSVGDFDAQTTANAHRVFGLG